MSDNKESAVPIFPIIDEQSICTEDYVADGKNKKLVTCFTCKSKVLTPGSGKYIKKEFDIPQVKKKTDDSSGVYEQLTHFWEVADMYTFENIGFSHTMGTIKYLACADCEVGPIGYHDTTSKISYVALTRVNHV